MTLGCPLLFLFMVVLKQVEGITLLLACKSSLLYCPSVISLSYTRHVLYCWMFFRGCCRLSSEFSLLQTLSVGYVCNFKYIKQL